MDSFFSTETLGLFSAGLLVVGILKFILYYKAFNVEILKYIESSEILLLFADNVSIAALAILILIPPYVYSLMPYMASGVGMSCSFQETLAIFWALLGFHIKYQFVLLIIFISFSFTRPKITFFEKVTYVLLSIVIFIIIPFTSLWFWNNNLGIISSKMMIISILIISFFVMIMLATYNEVYKVKNKGYFSNTEVELDGLTVPSGAYYIGQVKSFIFFYNPKTSESITFKTDKVKKVTYKPAVIKKKRIMPISRSILRLIMRIVP